MVARVVFCWGLVVGLALGIVLPPLLSSTSAGRDDGERGKWSATRRARTSGLRATTLAPNVLPLARLAPCRRGGQAEMSLLTFNSTLGVIRNAQYATCLSVGDDGALFTAGCDEDDPARFRISPDGQLIHEDSGSCVDDLMGKGVIGLWGCAGRSDKQMWTIDTHGIHAKSNAEMCIAFDLKATVAQLQGGLQRARARAARRQPSASRTSSAAVSAPWASQTQHTLFRWSDIRPPTGMAVAPLETLRASRLNVGDVQLVRQFLRRVQSKQCTSVLVLGGSISAGHGVGGLPGAYPTRFAKWLNDAFPCTSAATGGRGRHKLVNRAVPATGSNYWFSKVAQFASMPIDLVLVEFSINDMDEGCSKSTMSKSDKEKLQGKEGVPKCAISVYTEALIRNLMRLPSHPAILYLETGALSKGFDALFPAASGAAPGAFVRGLPWGFPAAIGAEASREHFGVCQYYGIPIVSLLDALYPSVVKASSKAQRGAYPWTPVAMDWVRARCDGSAVLHSERKSVQWCKRTGTRNRDPKHLSPDGHRFAAQLLVHTMLDEMDRLESFIEPVDYLAMDQVKTLYLAKYRLLDWEHSPVDSLDLTAAVAPKRVASNSGWSLKEDVPGKPGYIATAPDALLTLHIKAANFIMIGYLISYRNIGRVRVWFDDDKKSSGIVLDGLVKEKVSILHQTEVALPRSGRASGGSDAEARAHTIHFQLLDVGADTAGANKFKLLEITSY